MFMLFLPLVGCQSLGSEFVAGAEEKLRLKWAEEWKPALQEEMAKGLDSAKESVLKETAAQIELQESVITAKLESVNVRLLDFDKNNDGKVTGEESAALLMALKDAKDKDGKPLGWYEILMAVVLGYGGTTAGKEWVKSRMVKKEGFGSLGTV